MSEGVYGQVIPANVSSDDVDIWYKYSETRNASSSAEYDFKKLDSNI